jgi:transposase
MQQVIIGVDPHKLSATIEVVDQQEKVLGSGRFATDKAGYTAMLNYVAQWSTPTWAVEGSNGAGRPLAQRLVADGQHVLDVPAKLAARVRLLDTGHGRKTDAHDAHAVAVAAVRARELRVLAADPGLEAMRCLKRRISDALYRELLHDARAAAAKPPGTGPGGHCGATLDSSAVDLPPHIDTSDQPLPGPAEPTLQPVRRLRKTPVLKAG